ncbi:uncharacterized protein WCC33_016625 [Rhinophrynus dorsalis]
MAALKLKKFSMEETSNMEAHRTDYYNSSVLILRRAQAFSIKLNFNRPLQKGDKVEFVAATGPSPHESDNTMAVFQLSSSAKESSWKAIPESSSSTAVSVTVISPADAIIGRYKLNLYISSKKKKAYFKLNEFILLFNPWIPDDVVYMEDEDERQEYVLNDSGIIYYGFEDHINEQGWDFGQFEESILEICLQILDKSLNYQNDPEVDCSQRNDPAYVGRVVSAMINSNDDNGVIVGNWSGNYAGGVSPVSWTGSVQILRKWIKSGPVRYGQCWVFAGVLCTVMRCLGIPTRIITNFSSAHDTNENLSIDSFYDPEGNSLDSTDSIWNFHVWNEAWFTRNDLGPFYDGWQVLDATPQEPSQGIFRLGPTSVKAVKEGHIQLNCDGPFVFSEVNADIDTWLFYADNNSYERIETDSYTIGKFTSTKAVGTSARLDITSNYKYEEGSDKERDVYYNAYGQLFGRAAMADTGNSIFAAAAAAGRVRRKVRKPTTKPGVSGKLKIVKDPLLGQDINLLLIFSNTASSIKTIKINLNVTATGYTRKRMRKFMNELKSITLGPKEEKEIPVKIPYSQYASAITDDNVIEVTGLCEIEAEKLLITKSITLVSPNVDIKVLNKAALQKPINVEVTFTNPLSESLEDCTLYAEGSGLIKEQIVKSISMKPNEKMNIPLHFTPYTKGSKQLQIVVNCHTFLTLKGYKNIDASPISKYVRKQKDCTLQLTNVDLQKNANASAHKTSVFISDTLILRRAQPFTCALNFNKTVQSTDRLSFIVETGPAPSEATKTRAVMLISGSGDRNSWSASRGTGSGSSFTATINIPPYAVIGRYNFSLQISSGGRTFSTRLGEFILLFNAWAPGDDVFLDSEAERTEYVLNETGQIFYGNTNYQGSRRWDYAQFEANMVDIVLNMMDMSPDYRNDPAGNVARRYDPGYVARFLSAMVNSNDDKGVVLGNWSGNYSGGQSPTSWNGSAAILRSWRDNGPVKYGQCWVFAGVLGTVLRCLGIPTRVITNYESAHDTNKNLIIEENYDSNGRPIRSPDSVWNFHVWNEGWFVRKDLDPIYSGWQVLDATPQEMSQYPSDPISSFRLGPCSRKAVKEGEVNMSYDTAFVYAEMNADKNQYIQYSDGRRTKVHSDTKSVGQFTSTKAVGAFTRVDVTNDYKYPEGSAKEREINAKARQLIQGSSARMAGFAGFGMGGAAAAAPAPKPEITGDFKVSGQPQVGDDFTIDLCIKNTAADNKDVKVSMTATTIVYTRAPVKEIQNDVKSVKLGPNRENCVTYTVTFAQYEHAITTDNMILFSAVCEDNKGGKLLVETVITLKSPPLILKLSGQASVGKPVNVEIVFPNPIKEDIPSSKLIVEGSGLLNGQLKIDVPIMKANQRSITSFEITPYRSGPRTLLVDYSSSLLHDVKAFQTITVASRKK